MKLTWRIWLLIILLVLCIISIFGVPPLFLQKGVKITSVNQNSTAFEQGLRQEQIITNIDNNKINNINDFSDAFKNKFNGENVKTTITTNQGEFILYSNQPPEITVSETKNTNLKMGLDLAGGARALVKAENIKLSSEQVDDLISITRNRLNVYGLSDVNVRAVSDLTGEYFMLVEIAGATPDDLENLISKQGKFEAKIGNETVFVGGEKDISSVCRNDATCAGISNCQTTENRAYCTFQFVIYLSEDAAKKHADITNKIGLSVNNSNYLEKQLDLYVDDNLIDSLWISKDLKSRITTQIQIQGSGTGETEQDAYGNTLESMNKLQTILITGSLPYKLEIVKLDTISPTLGKDFINVILLTAVSALLAVYLVIFLKYKSIKYSLAILLTSLSEIIIVLGISSFINWNLDLPSIAGILATIGTGVDDQIVILDEARHTKILSIKERIKRAFAIIFGAYFTVLVSLLPLMWAGAGLLKGFAITTIIGITAGVLITRPAFSDIIENIEG